MFFIDQGSDMIRFSLLSSVLLLMIGGCSDSAPGVASSDVTPPPVRQAEPGDDPPVLLPSELRRLLKANENAKFNRVGNVIVEAELFQSGVKSIDALKGLPLRSVDLGMTEVSDISPLAGMPLRRLILENTPVSDISVIKGMPLEVLYLQNTKVTDISIVAGMPLRELNLLNVPVSDLTQIAELPLETLWIPRTKVTDLSPLAGRTLVSLDVQATEVSDLSPLSDMMTLRRLNIANTPVTDLTPLKGLKLERITLTPETITSGMEVLRDMSSLTQILTSMYTETRQSAAEFWQKYDAGVWKDKGDPPDSSESPKDSLPDAESPGDKKNGAATSEESKVPADADPEEKSVPE